MILITSGAFISSEFQVELGKIPPALVPLGNKRLYEHQVTVLQSSFLGDDIFLSLTEAYSLRKTDALLMQKLGINIIWVPNDLSLGDSLLYVINSIGRYDETLKILHGDTYFDHFPQGEDVVAVSQPEDDYAWEAEQDVSSVQKVWCGFFSFSDVKLLARSLAATRGSFTSAVRNYHSHQPVTYPVIDNWYDMGHVNTYFRSRSKVTTQRAFNQLKVADGIVEKSSSRSGKIQAEAEWFSNLPAALKKYTPQLIDSKQYADNYIYQLEYLPLLPLNELFVHGNLPVLFWRKIFRLVNQFLIACNSAVSLTVAEKSKINNDLQQLLNKKTKVRLYEYSQAAALSLSLPTSINGRVLPSVEDILEDCIAGTAATISIPGVSHGDLCFSNILYESRTNSIKVIDPRGVNMSGQITILGDIRYDIAKFVHSVIGLYDHIIAGLYTFKEVSFMKYELEIHIDDTTLALQRIFESEVHLAGISCKQIMPIVILLFMSMLPLHADRPERQQAFLANALRLYAKWKDS